MRRFVNFQLAWSLVLVRNWSIYIFLFFDFLVEVECLQMLKVSQLFVKVVFNGQ